MLALAVSILITAYLIIPEALARITFGRFVPVRTFVLSRTETVYRAAFISGIPLLIAYLAVWFIPFAQRYPFHFNDTIQLRRADYKLVTAAVYSDQIFREKELQFWPALTRSVRRQLRLLAWYYACLLLLAIAAGIVARTIPRYRKKNAALMFLSDKILFPYISQWHVLLTPFMVPGSTVQADILCTDGTLYKGVVGPHFVSDGKLIGLILTSPFRYKREDYVQAKRAGENPDKNKFWSQIPSANLYFFSDKILNMNLRYENPESMEKFVAEQLGDSDVSITIDVIPPAKPEPPPPGS